jgi:hypothetical protein
MDRDASTRKMPLAHAMHHGEHRLHSCNTLNLSIENNSVYIIICQQKEKKYLFTFLNNEFGDTNKLNNN